MQTTALIQVINCLKEISEDATLLELYKNLMEIINKAIKNPKADFSAEILKEKNALQNFLIDKDPMDLGYASYCLYESINSDQLFGKAAANYIENLMTPENKDYKTTHSDLNQRINLISAFSDNMNKIRQMFDQIVPSEVFQVAENNEHKSSLLLYFEGHMAVQNIADLERYARLWDGILGTFSRLTGENNLNLNISNINNFNNGKIVLEVAIEDKTLNSFMSGVVGILSVLPDILKIRQIQLDLALLPLHTDFNELLEEEIQILIDNTSSLAAQKLISGYYNDSINTQEITNELLRSLKQILSFIEKNGKIECNPLISTDDGTIINKKIIESISLANELEKVNCQVASTLMNREEYLNGNEPVERIA